MKKGFTLVEMLAVVLIVAILSGVALPQYRKVVEKAHATEAESMLRTIYDSSERLAGEFGYDSYDALVRAEGANRVSFARMDMFDADNLPSGCSLNGATELKCPNFTYKPLVSHRYIVAKRINKTYGGTLIGFDRETSDLVCKGTGCEIYGLKVNSRLTY